MAGATGDLTVVVGLARSGIGAARLLRQMGHAVLVIDSQGGPALEALATELRDGGIHVQLNAPLNPDTFTALKSLPVAVVVSPVIRWDHPTLETLRHQGVTILGEIDLAWKANDAAVPWIGITGTNGKTTVTHMVSHILQHAGLKAPMGGNVGFSAAELVLKQIENRTTLPDWLVVELSSYQIEAAPQVAPNIGIWTTLTPDHLERHGCIEKYRAIKRSLLDRSKLRILNADDPDLRAHASSWDHATWITTGHRNELPASCQASLWIEDGQVMRAVLSGTGTEFEPLMAADCLAMPGAHNRQNLLLAAATGQAAGLTGPQMEKAFRSFAGVSHRLESVGNNQNIQYINDSKATNYDAAVVAINALEAPQIVIAGGQSKQGNSTGWLEALHQKAAAVVLFGASKNEFKALLKEAEFAGVVQCCDGLGEAVSIASRLAKNLRCKTVLLSPACASFDQYVDFQARGNHFRQLVKNLCDPQE